MAQLHLRRLQPSESRELHAWISERHYLKGCPPGHRYALEFMIGSERVGAMLLGRPSALAMMRRWVRVWAPSVRGLLSYSDAAAGHAGTVYLADGWAPFGTTSNGDSGWRNRPGRTATGRPTRKIRWVRTP